MDGQAQVVRMLRLDEVHADLTTEMLHAALRRGQAAYENTNRYHPRTYRGLVFWGESTGGLRLELGACGWTPDDTKNFSTAVDPSKRIAIAVATSDANAGRSGGDPRLKYLKGDAVQYAVLAGQGQGDFFLGYQEKEETEDAPQVWFFLVNRTSKAIYSELSKPRSMTPDGQVTGWEVRALIEPLILDTEELGQDPEPDPTPEIDVPVTKKTK